MSLIVVGLNHRTAPVDLLERMTVPEELLAKVLHDLGAREHLLEVVVLSTCNRIEVYARCTHFHPAVGDVERLPLRLSGAAPEDFAELLYTYYDEAAVSHLFSVAAGLDSMIVGESEILGQVREAWQAAVREGTAPQLAGLFRHAVESGKRVRTETGIGRHPVSIPSAAVSVAAEHLGTFEGAKVLVVGAGQMATGLASTLRARGVEHVWIANRTLSRAQEVAERIGGRGDPAHRDRRHAGRRRRAAVVDRVDAGARRARDDRDGHGVPRRPPAARRRRGACPATSTRACARSTT